MTDHAAQPAPARAGDAEQVLTDHRAIVSGDDDGWHVICSCGHNDLGTDPIPHQATALAAAGLLDNGLRERVRALADAWSGLPCRPESWWRVGAELTALLDADGGDRE